MKLSVLAAHFAMEVSLLLQLRLVGRTRNTKTKPGNPHLPLELDVQEERATVNRVNLFAKYPPVYTVVFFAYIRRFIEILASTIEICSQSCLTTCRHVLRRRTHRLLIKS